MITWSDYMTKDNENAYGVVLGICIRTLVNIVFVLLLVEGFTYSYHFSYKVFADLPMVAASSEVKEIAIGEGSSAKDVSVLLETNGVIEDKYIFLVRAYLGKYNNKIIAGTYSLSPSMTPDEICRMICGMQSEETS